MRPGTGVTTVMCAMALGSVWLGAASSAQAGTVTETFAVIMTGIQWCEGNPKFGEKFIVKVDPKHPATNTILTLTRDVLNNGDHTAIQAMLNTQGGNAELEEMILNGQALPSNKPQTLAQLILAGTHPTNPDHFFTIRGQVTLDLLDNLTKVTGTFAFRVTDTYTTDLKSGAQSGPVDCFTSGTFTTAQKLSSSGGDFDNYVPFTQGSTWTYRGTLSETRQPTTHYQNVVTISGTKLIGGITATVISQSNWDGLGTPLEEYYTKDDTGITDYGDNDATDPLTPQYVPFQALQFPLRVGASFQAVKKIGLDWGEDVDGDGRNETVNLTAQVTVVKVGTMTVPAGTFPHTAVINTQVRGAIILSASGARIPIKETQTAWFAPGIGQILWYDVQQVRGHMWTQLEELLSYVVNK